MKYILRLYISGRTPLSEKAIKNAKNICKEELKGKYKLQVIDLTKNSQLAEDERIFVTPILEKKFPPPLRRIIGDLSIKEKVLIGLDLVESINVAKV